MEKGDNLIAKGITVSSLPKEQQDALKEFRTRLQGCGASEERLQDHLLLQWLKARNFSVDKAENMFRKSEEWRKKYDMEGILQYKRPEVVEKFAPDGRPGFDKYGGAVVIVAYGRTDMRGLLSSLTIADYIKSTAWCLEKCKEAMGEESQRRGYPVCQLTIIFDLEGFSFKDFTYKPVLDAIIVLMQMYESYYPELLRVAYVVNAPKIFTIAYAMLKPFLHEATVKKVQIFGRSGWQELVAQDVDAAVLPKHWGGARVDPDGNEMCPSVICLCGPVPKEYYLKNKSKDNKKHFKAAIVPAGGSEKLRFKVSTPNSVIKWEFETDDYDIAFSVYKEGAVEEPLVPHQRVNSHLAPEEGQVICHSTGTYVFQFDNSYSYVNEKKIHYSVELL